MAVCNLPVEIIAKILLYLDVKSQGRAAQVCSSWREASFYRPAWCGVRAAIKIDDSAEFVCTSLGRRDIRDVRVTCLQRSLMHNLQLVPHLERLDLSRCTNLSDSNLTRTFKTKFSHLTHLSLSMCTDVDTEGVRAALYALEKLQVLDLSGCVKILDDVLFEIALMLPKLISLNIAHTSVSSRGLRYFSAYHKHRRLKFLILKNCQRITDSGLESISQSLKELIALDLSRCNSVTDHGMIHVANIITLKELNLEHCSWLTDFGLTFLSRNLQLTSLTIGPSEVTNGGIFTIATFMRTLQQLVLNSCRVGDTGVQFLCRSLLDLQKLIILKCDITDRCLLKIHDYCVHRGLLPSLRYIDVYGCRKVTSAGVWKLLKVPGMVLKKPGLIVKLSQ